MDLSQGIHKCHIVKHSKFTTVLASGNTKSLVALAQLLAWLGASFRLPEYGALTSSRVHFHRSGPPVSIDSSRRAEFDLTLNQLRPTEASDGTCWRPMFANSVIAEGFPVPERRGEVGLEISFEAMVTLNKILFPLEIPDGIVLKGNSTLLLPLAGDRESVQWHLLCNAQPTENIGLNAIPDHCRSQLLHLDLRTLSQARTFVGYCRDALVIVGTRDSGY